MSNLEKSRTAIRLKCILAVLMVFTILVVDVVICFGKLPALIGPANWIGFISWIVPAIVLLGYSLDKKRNASRKTQTVGLIVSVIAMLSFLNATKWVTMPFLLISTTNILISVFWVFVLFVLTLALWNEEEDEKS